MMKRKYQDFKLVPFPKMRRVLKWHDGHVGRHCPRPWVCAIVRVLDYRLSRCAKSFLCERPARCDG